jgi:hypothetical protein
MKRGLSRVRRVTLVGSGHGVRPAERQVVLGMLAAVLLVAPLACHYARTSNGINDVVCAALLVGLIPFARRFERWPAQPAMLVGFWLLLSALAVRDDRVFLVNLLSGSFVVMISTTNPPGNARLRSIAGAGGDSSNDYERQ